MEVRCENCKTKFKVADSKLPAGQLLSLKCPKCESKIEVDTRAGAGAATAAATLQSFMDETASDTYDADLRAFDFLEEGVETALICEQDEGMRAKIRAVLEEMEYNITEAASTRDALKYMRFHPFNLVILDQGFDAGDPDSNYVLRYVAQLPTTARREVFVVLVGNDFTTGDYMMAFNKSVNLVLNLENMDEFEKFLRLSLSDHQEFYRVFKESAKRVGRA